MLLGCVWPDISMRNHLKIMSLGAGMDLSHLRAGSLPKKATKVMKEMKSTMSAMVVTVPMAAAGWTSPISLSNVYE